MLVYYYSLKNWKNPVISLLIIVLQTDPPTRKILLAEIIAVAITTLSRTSDPKRLA